jgi:hypothetical protein
MRQARERWPPAASIRRPAGRMRLRQQIKTRKKRPPRRIHPRGTHGRATGRERFSLAGLTDMNFHRKVLRVKHIISQQCITDGKSVGMAYSFQKQTVHDGEHVEIILIYKFLVLNNLHFTFYSDQAFF